MYDNAAAERVAMRAPDWCDLEAGRNVVERAATYEGTGQGNAFMGRAAVVGHYNASRGDSEPETPPPAVAANMGTVDPDFDRWGRQRPDEAAAVEHLAGAAAARAHLANLGMPPTRYARERMEQRGK
jgi:hypothetical protein